MLTKIKFLKDIFLNFSSTAITMLAIQFLYYPQILKSNNNEVFGEFLLIVALINLVAGSIGGALSNLYLKYYAKWQQDECIYYQNLMFISLVTSIVTGIFFVILLNIILKNDFFNNNIFYIIIFLVLSINKVLLLSWFRVRLKYGQIVISNGLSAIIYLLGWFLLKYNFLDNVFIIMIISELLIYLYLSGVALPRLLVLPKFSKEIVKLLLKPLLLLLSSSIFLVLYKYIDRIIIFFVGDSKEIAIFYAANVVGLLFAVPFNIISNVIFSYLARISNIDKKLIWNLAFFPIIISIIAYVLTYFFGPYLIQHLYPTVFDEAMEIFYVLNIGNAIIITEYILRGFIIKFYEEKVKMKIDCISLVLFVTISFVLFSYLGLLGIAVGYTLGIVLKAFLNYYLVFRSFKFKENMS